MTDFEIRDIKGNWLRAKFKAEAPATNEIECGLLLQREIRARKLPGKPDAYYLKAFEPRRGWIEHRPS